MHRPSWFIVVAVASVVRQSCPTHHGEGAVDDKLNPCRRRLRNYTTPAGGRPGPVACHRRDRGRKPVGARRLFARAVPLLRLRRAASAERPTDRRLKLRRWSRTVSCGSRRSRDLDLKLYVRASDESTGRRHCCLSPAESSQGSASGDVIATDSTLTVYCSVCIRTCKWKACAAGERERRFWREESSWNFYDITVAGLIYYGTDL